MLIEIRTAKITEKGQITIPKESRIDGFKVGEKVAIFTFEDRIEIKSMKDAAEDMFPALMSEESLAESWNSKEDEEAWKNL